MYKIWDINVRTPHITDTQCMLHLYSDVQKTNIIFVNGTYTWLIMYALTHIMANLVICLRLYIMYSLMKEDELWEEGDEHAKPERGQN